MLALCTSKFKAQARADFLSVYGVDFDAVSVSRPLYAADLAAMLPPTTETYRCIHPKDAPPPEWAVLWSVELDLRRIQWSLGGCKGPAPALLGTSPTVPDKADMMGVADALGIDV